MNLMLAERTHTISFRYLVIDKLGKEKEPYNLGEELSFAMDLTADPYCNEGFWMNTGICTRLVGPNFKMEIPFANLPKRGELIGHFDVLDEGRKTQPFVMYANGAKILEGEVTSATQDTGLDFVIPVSGFDKKKTLTLEIQFPEISQDEIELPVDQRTQTISLTSLVIDQQK